jgi:hypothetical protein
LHRDRTGAVLAAARATTWAPGDLFTTFGMPSLT